MQHPPGRRPDVAVIGGGVAGLTAAVDLASHGYSVLLIEQKEHCGGRTYSFVHEETGDDVDNGQHLMMGCYHATLRFLGTIGSLRRISIQKNLSVSFRHPEKGASMLRAASLLAPLNLLVGLLRLKSLSLIQRIMLFRVGAALISRAPGEEERLRSMTVSQWLDSLSQPDENKKYLWDILAIGTLNDSPSVVSAALFVKVLRSAFMGTSSDSSMVIPREGLSRIFADSAVDYLTKHGGRVILGKGVGALHVQNGVVTTVSLDDGEEITPRAVISAVPYFGLTKMLGEEALRSFPEFRSLDGFRPSAIITIHLWFDIPFVDEEFVALLDSPIHWVFNKSKLLSGRKSGLSYLSLVVSGATDLAEIGKEKLVEMAILELRRFYPESAKANLVHSLVIKEKRATFSPRVGTEALRPSHTSAVKNFFLAGDWTDTKLPATIEGAVQSGYACSELARKYVGQVTNLANN